MSEEKPQVVDKRRFAGANVESGEGAVLSPEDFDQTKEAMRGTVWHLRPDGDYENRQTGDIVPHGMFPEPSEGQDSWRTGPYEQPAAQFSPSSDPNKPSTMDCGTALRLVGEGKRVSRLAWDNPETFLLMFMWGAINPEVPAGKYLSIHHANGNVHPLYLNDGDLLGNDWVVV